MKQQKTYVGPIWTREHTLDEIIFAYEVLALEKDMKGQPIDQAWMSTIWYFLHRNPMFCEAMLCGGLEDGPRIFP